MKELRIADFNRCPYSTGSQPPVISHYMMSMELVPESRAEPGDLW